MELLIAIVVLAVIFDFINGFHDSANSIATIVSTRVLTPLQAVVWAAFFNFVAFFIFKDHKVAAAIGKGVIDAKVLNLLVIIGGLSGAIVWNLVTWWWGIPSSSSHALVGGLVGAALIKAGTSAIIAAGITKILIFIIIAPILGIVTAFIIAVSVLHICKSLPTAKVDKYFRRLQLVSSALFSIGHGGNDAQKSMGVIWIALIIFYSHTSIKGLSENSSGLSSQQNLVFDKIKDVKGNSHFREYKDNLELVLSKIDDRVLNGKIDHLDTQSLAKLPLVDVTHNKHYTGLDLIKYAADSNCRPDVRTAAIGQTYYHDFVNAKCVENVGMPTWAALICYLAMGMGTMMGGWRIVKTMGQKVAQLKPFEGFCAETGGAVTLFATEALGIPTSTTHTITGCIMGAGMTKRLSAVRWGIAGNIIVAWIVTIPAAALMGGFTYFILQLFIKA
jgi:PiT family inorganic phosphate transporter